MPSRASSFKSQFIGTGVLLFLVIVGGVVLLNMWMNRRAAPPPAYQLSTPLATGASVGDGNAITIWFSDPLSGRKYGGPESNLVTAINGAQKSIDVAIYNLTLESIGSALVQAKNRGVQVRLVMESEAVDKQVPQSLLDVQIPIVGDQMEGLMHNKFMIIDGQEVWTGSMNYTNTSSYSDFNNLVRFRSPQLVSDYQAAFNEMFEGHKFGSRKVADTPYPLVMVGNVPVEVYFSPDDGVADHVVDELNKAQKRILFLAYSFTSDPFARAIKNRAAAGVTIRGVLDAGQIEANMGGEYETFKKAGYDVKKDGIPGLLHDKVFIIDDQVVITGSYNFSSNAEKTNDENLVIIRDAQAARQYLQHFEQVYGSAE